MTNGCVLNVTARITAPVIARWHANDSVEGQVCKMHEAPAQSVPLNFGTKVYNFKFLQENHQRRSKRKTLLQFFRGLSDYV